MDTSFAPCKTIGCTADFGTFSPSAGLGKPKSNEERLAMRGDGKRAGLWSQSNGVGLRRAQNNSVPLVLISEEGLLLWYSQC